MFWWFRRFLVELLSSAELYQKRHSEYISTIYLHDWQRNKPEDDDGSICQYVEDIAAIAFIGYRSASAMDKR